MKTYFIKNMLVRACKSQLELKISFNKSNEKWIIRF